MKEHLNTWILTLSTIVFTVLGILLLFIFSTSTTDADNQDLEFSTGQFIAQLPEDIPDFVIEVLREEGVDLEELKNDPELRREMREKVMSDPEIQEEFQKRKDGNMDKTPQGKTEGKPGGSKGDKPGGVVDEYYKSIVDNNLFRPLGSGGEKRGPAFRLIGTVITKNPKPKALIFEFATNTTHYVAVGDKIGNATVESIEEKSVNLNQDGKGELKLNIGQDSPFLGKGNGGRGGGPRASGGSPPKKNVRTSASRNNIPKEWREKLQNMSPAEREKAIRKFREAGEKKEAQEKSDNNPRRGGRRRNREVLRAR